MKIDQKVYHSLVGRAGLEAGIMNERGNLFARVSLAHEFMGDVEGLYQAKDGGAKTTKFGTKDSWVTVGIGGNYAVSDNVDLAVELSKDVTGDYRRDWNASLRLGYRF